MNNALRLFHTLLVLLFLMTSSLKAQVPLPERGVKSNQQAQTQQPSRQVDEQLARSFYNNKEYDKAAELYNNLYSQYHYFHYFSQYIECLFHLENYEEAEKSLKSFIKKDNTTNKWRAQVNLA